MLSHIQQLLVTGLLVSVRVLKEEHFLAYYVFNTGARLIRSENFHAELKKLMGV